MKRTNEVQFETEHRELALVPLDNEGRNHAVMYKEDYVYLTELLGLSCTWRMHPNGYVMAPAYLAKGGSVTVARVLMDTGAGETIRYMDGDKLNLRRDNLYVIEGGNSTRRDRDCLRRPKRRITTNERETI